MPNSNSYEYLEKIKLKIFENLKETTFAPSVQMQDVPSISLAMDEDLDAMLDDADEDDNPDERNTQRRSDQRVEASGELSDSEDEEDNGLPKGYKAQNRNAERNEISYGARVDDNDDQSSRSPPTSPRSVESAVSSEEQAVDMQEDVEMKDAEPFPDDAQNGKGKSPSEGDDSITSKQNAQRETSGEEEQGLAPKPTIAPDNGSSRGSTISPNSKA